MSNITVTAEDIKNQGASAVAMSSFMLALAYFGWTFNSPIWSIVMGVIGIRVLYVGIKMWNNAHSAVQKASDNY